VFVCGATSSRCAPSFFSNLVMRGSNFQNTCSHKKIGQVLHLSSAMRELRFIQASLLLALVHAKPIHPHDNKARRRTNTGKGHSPESLKHTDHKIWKRPKEVGSPNLRGHQQQKPPRALKNGGKVCEKSLGIWAHAMFVCDK
jgi:hypothetical protein